MKPTPLFVLATVATIGVAAFAIPVVAQQVMGQHGGMGMTGGGMMGGSMMAAMAAMMQAQMARQHGDMQGMGQGKMDDNVAKLSAPA